MKIIENRLIPFKGFLAMNLFGLFFVRKDEWNRHSDKIKEITINHESIHTVQMKETGYVFFYIIYFLEYLFRFLLNGFDSDKAYRNISFEKEAYENEDNFEYLGKRRRYAMWRK